MAELPKTCFAIMPFEGFDDVAKKIKTCAESNDLHYHRADRTARPGNVMSQILADIKNSALIVADITGARPNVYYELGIAHNVRGYDRVIILAQRGTKAPFDISEFRHIEYEPTKDGLDDLFDSLRTAMKEALMHREYEDRWEVISGKVARTKALARRLQQVLDREKKKQNLKEPDLNWLTIRLAASLGTLPISDDEPLTEEPEYRIALQHERNALRQLLLCGAKLRQVLSPPRRFAKQADPTRLQCRFERLVSLLEGRDDDPTISKEDRSAMKNVETVISPIYWPNLLIIGDEVAYEGVKRGGSGFDMTHVENNSATIQHLQKQFDDHYEASREDMVRAHPPDGQVVEQLKGFLEEANKYLERSSREPEVVATPA